MKAEVAAHAIQKSILTNAVRGQLAASAIFLTMGLPEGLEEETRKSSNHRLRAIASLAMCAS